MGDDPKLTCSRPRIAADRPRPRQHAINDFTPSASQCLYARIQNGLPHVSGSLEGRPVSPPFDDAKLVVNPALQAYVQHELTMQNFHPDDTGLLGPPPLRCAAVNKTHRYERT